jgi:hypothetical protein
VRKDELLGARNNVANISIARAENTAAVMGRRAVMIPQERNGGVWTAYGD